MTAISSKQRGWRRSRVDRQPARSRFRLRPAGLLLLSATCLRGALLAGLVAVAAGPAQAMAVAVAGNSGAGNSGNSGASALRYVPSAPAPGADAPTLELISARIDAVDGQAWTITVRGKLLPLHPGRLRVVGMGGQALSGIRALRPGMQVRFALEPEPHAGRAASAAAPYPAANVASSTDTAPAVRAVVLIYIDSQP
jgi:hypothetical protein